MFCPEGYTTLPRIFSRAYDNNFDWMLTRSKEMNSLADDEMIKLVLLLEEAPLDLLELAVWMALSWQARICSPDGRVMKLDLPSLLCAHSDRPVSLLDIDRAKELAGEPKDDRSGCLSNLNLPRLSAEQFERGYTEFCQDAHSVARSPWDYAQSIEAEHYHHRVPLFYERQHFTVSLDAFDYFDRLVPEETAPFRASAQILRPFVGWAFCVSTDFAESKDLANFTTDIVQTLQAREPKGGRPSDKRQTARRSYQAIFPDGHGSLSEKEVARMVNAHTGADTSVQTVMRAIKEISGV